MTIYGYTRVSSIEQAQDDRTSLADQERRIRGAVMMMGAEEPIIIVEPAVSGSMPLSQRPGGKELLDKMQRGDTLIAAKLDRLFRAAGDAIVTAEKFKTDGINLVLLDCGSEPVNSSGAAKLFFSMLASFAEFEKNRILERMAEGRKGKNARGGHIGGLAPYGYNVVGAGRIAMLERNEDEQRAIMQAVELRSQGMTLRAIGLTLTKMGMPTRNGKPWVATQIMRMLEP